MGVMYLLGFCEKTVSIFFSAVWFLYGGQTMEVAGGKMRVFRPLFLPLISCFYHSFLCYLRYRCLVAVGSLDSITYFGGGGRPAGVHLSQHY